jgi:co-chaperonin GroES (HSP10)
MTDCGLMPIEFNVIVDQDPVKEMIGSIIVPEMRKERDMHMETRGSIVAMSPLAFTYEEWPAGSRIPKVGDRVAFAQHAGAFIDGADGKKYRVLKDKDILAVLA